MIFKIEYAEGYLNSSMQDNDLIREIICSYNFTSLVKFSNIVNVLLVLRAINSAYCKKTQKQSKNVSTARNYKKKINTFKLF